MAENQAPRQQNSGSSVPIWLIAVIVLLILFSCGIMSMLYQRSASASATTETMPTQAAIAEAPSVTPSKTGGPQGPTATPTWTPRASNTPYLTPTFVNTAVPANINTRTSGFFTDNKIVISGSSGLPVIVPTNTKVVPRSEQTAIAQTATAAYEATSLASNATQVAGAATTAAGVATPLPNYWRGSYYANNSLSGTPVLVRDDANIDFDWGSGSPASTVPSDNFSVRWIRNEQMQDATYLFYVYSDDGARVYIDDVLIIDNWDNPSSRVQYETVKVGSGTYTLRVEYYENTGDAQIQVGWFLRNEGAWIGEYYRNDNLSGAPYFIRQDQRIDFDWGSGGPNGLNQSNDFSIRWLNYYDFDSGVYNFTVTYQDGVIVYVNNKKIIDKWGKNDTEKTSVASEYLSGDRELVVEYFKATGDGSIDFDISEQPTSIDTPPTKP